MPPPFGPRRFARWLRWAWLLEGAAQYFSGQTAHVRPAVGAAAARGGPAVVPARDGATPRCSAGRVFDLLAREEGDRACVALACGPHRDGADGALRPAFGGRPVRHTEAAWRSHLARWPRAGRARAGCGASGRDRLRLRAALPRDERRRDDERDDRRVPGARRRHGHARRRARPRRARALRLGVQRVHARQPARDGRRRAGDRPLGPGAAATSRRSRTFAAGCVVAAVAATGTRCSPGGRSRASAPAR